MSKMTRNAITMGSVFLPAAAQAHPGQHSDDLAWSLVHAFTQPDHLLTMALVAVWAGMFICVARWFFPWRSRSRSR